MWIMTPDGMFSVVKPMIGDIYFKAYGQEGDLVVRARAPEDLDNLRRRLCPELGTTVATPNRDYGWRAFVAPEALARTMARIVLTLDWDNFKDEVKHRQGPQRAATYGKVWSALLEIQYPRAGHWYDDEEPLFGDPIPVDGDPDALPLVVADTPAWTPQSRRGGRKGKRGK